MIIFSTYFPSSYAIMLMENKRELHLMLYFIVFFLMSCDCWCSIALPLSLQCVIMVFPVQTFFFYLFAIKHTPLFCVIFLRNIDRYSNFISIKRIERGYKRSGVHNDIQNINRSQVARCHLFAIKGINYTFLFLFVLLFSFVRLVCGLRPRQ